MSTTMYVACSITTLIVLTFFYLFYGRRPSFGLELVFILDRKTGEVHIAKISRHGPAEVAGVPPGALIKQYGGCSSMQDMSKDMHARFRQKYVDVPIRSGDRLTIKYIYEGDEHIVNLTAERHSWLRGLPSRKRVTEIIEEFVTGCRHIQLWTPFDTRF